MTIHSDTPLRQSQPTELLSVEHTILDRPFMEFRPFGVDELGEKIRDISGLIVQANVSYLEEWLEQSRGSGTGAPAVEDLCRLLNGRIRDPVFHVTPQFLKNPWNSYSYEFVCYLREFCERLTGDPSFHFHVGQEKHLSPLIQALGRPFSLSQIYRMWPHFGQKFAKGVVLDVGSVTDHSTVLRLKFTARSLQQFGPYRKACARLTCEASKGGISVVPTRIHGLPVARVEDRTCIVNGDEWCEWELSWTPPSQRTLSRRLWKSLLGRTPDGKPIMQEAVDQPHSQSHETTIGSGRRESPGTGKEGASAESQASDARLLSRDHTILERPFMLFRPFGTDEHGETIRDLSGVSVAPMVEYLERYVARTRGPEASRHVVQELCGLLNQRLRDPVYHVTPAFLKNAWHSYSCEFVAYLYELCELLSGDPDFAFNSGKEKASPLMQALAKPFPLQQIYGMYPFFASKYAAGSLECTVVALTPTSATLAMRFPAHVYRQFGLFRNRCAYVRCQAVKGILMAVPERVHGAPPAVVIDRACIADGDERCEWDIAWTEASPGGFLRRLWGELSGFADPKVLMRSAEARKDRPIPSSVGRQPSEQSGSGRPIGSTESLDERPSELLSKEHTILERPFMLYRPFGVDERGQKIRDASGITVRANVEYLEETVVRSKGKEAGARAVEELSQLLNHRIRDQAYHVTPDFLKNVWNSYSYEFVMYVAEFCALLSGDGEFQARMGREKLLSPTIQILGRPFALHQIYKMFPHFGQKYAKGSIHFAVGPVTERSAVLRMKYTDHVYRQFGPYRKACAALICQSSKAALGAVPYLIHHLPPAAIIDRTCIVNGDEWCEWEFSWTVESRRSTVGVIWDRLKGRKANGGADQSAPARTPSDRGSTASSVGAEAAGLVAGGNGRGEGELFSKDHTILERPFMLFRPFGMDQQGQKIQDFSGMMVRDNVDYLQDCVRRNKGQEAAGAVVEELCRLLNERIRDSAYHVTPSFLTTVWNSYSYEFASYLREFCKQLSGDTNFHYNVGKEKHISPLIQTLGRPFRLSQIHRMYPYFAQKFARGVECTVVEMSEYSAVLRLKFLPHVERQFGPYRKACAALTCESSKGRIAMVPLRLHNLPMSTVTDRRCIVNGDECCEWEVRWSPEPARRTVWPMWGAMAGAASFAYLRVAHPTVSLMEALLIALVPVLVSWVAMSRRVRRETFKREALIQEQVKFVEARHEELREAYLEQEQTRVQLRRKVNQLTALHQAGLLFNATLDRETLLSNVLETLVKELHYDRAMITFYDPVRRVTAEARVIGVTPEVQAFARSREIPVSDPNTVEGLVLLQGKPLLIGDIREWVDRMHPLNRRLAALTGTKSVIAVPLKTKDRILGSLTVDRMQEHSLNEDDLELMVTLANQVVIALDNVSAYRQIEELNVGLEAKVRERTAELEQADRIRTLFLRHVSHELRTPLTSMKGFIENMLDGLTGPLNEKQQAYLTRVLDNESRLIRMIEDLLDRTRIETGRLELVPSNVDLDACLAEVVEHLRPLAEAKRQALEASVPSSFPQVWADRDRLIQIVVNLVQNAIKFTPAGGRIGVAVEEAGEHFAGVRVRDNGPGIPSEYLEKIFDPFFRITQGQKGGPKGLGLGLSIVKTLVELHGGSITARSGPWQGAELSFTIPFVPDKAGPSRASASETKCVLVVDDDLDLQKMLSDRLGARGYRVETSGDGQHAVDAIRAQAFSGVMLDIGLPQLDGIEVLRRIRQVNEQVPVVVMTVWGTQQLAVQAISMGAQAYVLKPFDLAELQRVLDTWFGPIGHGGS